MFFFISFFTGFLMTFGSLMLEKNLRLRWGLKRTLFWKAGLWHLVIGWWAALVLGKILQMSEPFSATHVWISAIIGGIVSGLFFELGKYVILDKVVKNVRSLKETLYFGLGWSGVIIILTGILLMVGSVGTSFLLQINDLPQTFRELDPDQIRLLEKTREETLKLSRDWVSAFYPALEVLGTMIIEISLMLSVVFALVQQRTAYVWASVAFRFFLVATMFHMGSQRSFSSLLVLSAFAVLAGISARRISLHWPNSNSLKNTANRLP